ncbi:hypothetical protein Dimus_024315 [Dionaea muscipula]
MLDGRLRMRKRWFQKLLNQKHQFKANVDERSIDEDVSALTVPSTPVQTSVHPDGKTKATRVDTSGPSGHLPDFDLLHLQVEFARALQANTRFQELYQQMIFKGTENEDLTYMEDKFFDLVVQWIW